MKHWSDCATHNEPAYPVGACDCGGIPESKDELIGLLSRVRFNRMTLHTTPDGKVNVQIPSHS
ncbi:hypothetical protein LCGC14_2106070 [marine sediment metagenome]|uniref:Uncharacterized protein n=1 Tax=marine sediment metagenome TaxID=412755 RepID=A0A0F9EVT7_9ZZZZ